MSGKAMAVVVLLACVLTANARPFNRLSIRGLLGVNYLSPEAVMANNQRAQATTAQEIERAVDNGGSMASTARAGRVGSLMAWASAASAANPNAQSGQATFSLAERFARDWP